MPFEQILYALVSVAFIAPHLASYGFLICCSCMHIKTIIRCTKRLKGLNMAIPSIFILLFFAPYSYVWSLPLDLPPSPATFNLQDLASNTTTLSAAGDIYCTSSHTWMDRKWDRNIMNDCRGTAESLYRDMMYPHKVDETYEFLPTGATRSKSIYKAVRTPRRYVSGESLHNHNDISRITELLAISLWITGACTTAIVNLFDVPEQYLPRTTIALPLSDITNFRRVSEAYLDVSLTCCSLQNKMGYTIFGKSN